MMKKRILSLLLALVMVLTILPTVALAEDATAASGSCGTDAEWSYQNGVLKITGSGEMSNYVANERSDTRPWKLFAAEIEEVQIADGITKIGNEAFRNCPKLAKVNFPASLTVIGDYSFRDDILLQELVIPGTVETVGAAAFRGCTGLTKLTLEEGIQELKTARYGESIWDDGSFQDCTGLTSVKIPASCKTVGRAAFQGCSNLSKIDFPEGVETVADHAVRMCNIPYIAYPASMTEISPAAPKGMKSGLVINDLGGIGSTCNYKLLEISREVTLILLFTNQQNNLDLGFLDNDNGKQRTTNAEIVSIPDNGKKGSCRLGEGNGVAKLSIGTDETITVIKGTDLSNQLAVQQPDMTSDGTAKEFSATCEGIDDLEITYYKANGEKLNAAPSEPGEYRVLIFGYNEQGEHASYYESFTITEAAADEPDMGFVAGLISAVSGSNPFSDVAGGAYYNEAVRWAVKYGIASGTDAKHFSPDAACTRGQAVTFLWRAAGCPAPALAENPFADVKPTDYCYDAVLWAVQTGVAKGTSASTFAPDAPCTRGQIVTFLYRAAGSPSGYANSGYVDVPETSYCAAPVAWAVALRVTSGTSALTFSPDTLCTRAQIVTFLYRANA